MGMVMSTSVQNPAQGKLLQCGWLNRASYRVPISQLCTTSTQEARPQVLIEPLSCALGARHDRFHLLALLLQTNILLGACPKTQDTMTLPVLRHGLGVMSSLLSKDK
jgi:hypothetical protein